MKEDTISYYTIVVKSMQGILDTTRVYGKLGILELHKCQSFIYHTYFTPYVNDNN
jgi:hypothetical protein